MRCAQPSTKRYSHDPQAITYSTSNPGYTRPGREVICQQIRVTPYPQLVRSSRKLDSISMMTSKSGRTPTSSSQHAQMISPYPYGMSCQDLIKLCRCSCLCFAEVLSVALCPPHPPSLSLSSTYPLARKRRRRQGQRSHACAHTHDHSFIPCMK